LGVTIMLAGWMRRRRAVRRDAEMMLHAMPARDAWHAARRLGRDMAHSDDERAHWWRVVRWAERRAGLRRDASGSGFAPPL
jgi:hypothetical protein